MASRRKTIRPHLGPARLAGLLAAMLLAPAMAAAEVTSTDANGFGIVQQRNLPGVTPQQAWAAMTRRVGSWWDPSHTWSGDASKLNLEAKPDGCFCEWLPNGGWAEHMRVVYLVPGQSLRLRGGLGPLMELGLSGTMTWRVSARETSGDTAAGTLVEWRYIVSGHRPEGFADLAPAVDGVLGQQLDRLADSLASQP
ncbi:SRPBCC family protein [Marinihelvus fidelis]|nr:SRPBCC family protein [Marinihelvus fidelis]